MTKEQQIRAHALLAAVTWARDLSTIEMLKYAERFADYIRSEDE